MMDYRITGAEAVDDRHAKITWSDGLEAVVDFSDLMEQGGSYAELADPAIFAHIGIYEYGHGIYWSGADGQEIDVCPDVLRAKADPKVAAWIAAEEAAWHSRQAAE